ncbi:MAG TPA: M67 family metallopeptidase [Thermoplasmata archaeon]|nr:M67 family metallopeptidase [Thermoplasmata archaeon]
MTIEIPKAVVRAIEDHARDAFPEECCGFLFGHADESRRVVEVRLAKNVASEDREHRYVVDPLELLHADNEARAKGLELIGIYHSHPNHPAAPSEFDRSRAASWYSYLILRIVDRQPRELTAWLFDEGTRRFEPDEVVHPRRKATKPVRSGHNS